MEIVDEIMRYARNYRSRHANNINLVLHIIGIPEVLFGLFQILTGKWKMGLLNFFLGYLWQWIGHTYFEKDEMGEIIGIKKLVEKYIRTRK
jgi:hypothetical protein